MGKKKSNNYGGNFDHKNNCPAEIHFLSQFFPNLSKYFLGINLHFDDVSELSSLLTHDTLSDLK